MAAEAGRDREQERGQQRSAAIPQGDEPVGEEQRGGQRHERDEPHCLGPAAQRAAPEREKRRMKWSIANARQFMADPILRAAGDVRGPHREFQRTAHIEGHRAIDALVTRLDALEDDAPHESQGEGRDDHRPDDEEQSIAILTHEGTKHEPGQASPIPSRSIGLQAFGACFSMSETVLHLDWGQPRRARPPARPTQEVGGFLPYRNRLLYTGTESSTLDAPVSGAGVTCIRTLSCLRLP